MSTKLKILIGLLAVYTIVISVLLIIAGRKLRQGNSGNPKYQELESLITDVKKQNSELLENNKSNELKMDSISTLIHRVDRGIDELKKDEIAVTKKWDSEINELNNKTLLEKKKIALEK